MAKIFTEDENNAWAKQLPGKMTSACLAIRDNGKVLMVKASYKDHWTFPSGIVDDNESPRQAAVRETEEETGLIFNESNPTLLGVVYTASDGKTRERFNFCFATRVEDIDSLDIKIPNDEIEAYRWVEFSEIVAMSGNKASYACFRSILLGEVHSPVYVEINPS